MIDIVGEGLRLLSNRSPLAVPALFCAGLTTSVGPCIAPRYLAVAALARHSRQPVSTATAFGFGVVGAYVVIGTCAGMLGSLARWSTAVDAALAVALAVAGFAMLLGNAPPHVHDLRCAGQNFTGRPRASHESAAHAARVACMGAASAIVVSPCCAPVIAIVAGSAALMSRPLDAAVLLAAFATGHVLPLAVAAACGANSLSRVPGLAGAGAFSTVGGTVFLAFAAFYGTLA